MLATALLVFLAALIPVQDDETVKDFKKFFRKSKDPVERVELILSLEDIESSAVTKVMLPILKGKSEAEAQAALRIISALKEVESRAPMLSILEDGQLLAESEVLEDEVGAGTE